MLAAQTRSTKLYIPFFFFSLLLTSLRVSICPVLQGGSEHDGNATSVIRDVSILGHVHLAQAGFWATTPGVITQVYTAYTGMVAFGLVLCINYLCYETVRTKYEHRCRAQTVS